MLGQNTSRGTGRFYVGGGNPAGRSWSWSIEGGPRPENLKTRAGKSSEGSGGQWNGAGAGYRLKRGRQGVAGPLRLLGQFHEAVGRAVEAAGQLKPDGS